MIREQIIAKSVDSVVAHNPVTRLLALASVAEGVRGSALGADRWLDPV
jgi:hypothetical protein